MLFENWYAVRTHQKQEKRAQQNLEDQGFPSLALFYSRQQRTTYFNRLIFEPLFPQYIFSQFDYQKSSQAVNNSRGVYSILKFADSPVPVSQLIIDELLLRVGEDGLVKMDERIQTSGFVEGERVIITSGSATGIEGIFRRDLKGGDRVIILMSFLGRLQEVPLPVSDVRPLAVA